MLFRRFNARVTFDLRLTLTITSTPLFPSARQSASLGLQSRSAVSACYLCLRSLPAISVCSFGLRSCSTVTVCELCLLSRSVCSLGLRSRSAISVCDLCLLSRSAVSVCGLCLRSRSAISACDLGLLFRSAVSVCCLYLLSRCRSKCLPGLLSIVLWRAWEFNLVMCFRKGLDDCQFLAVFLLLLLRMIIRTIRQQY